MRWQTGRHLVGEALLEEDVGDGGRACCKVGQGCTGRSWGRPAKLLHLRQQELKVLLVVATICPAALAGTRALLHVLEALSERLSAARLGTSVPTSAGQVGAGASGGVSPVE